MELGGWTYVAAFFVSLSLSLVLTPLALRLAVSREIFDNPGAHKIQESPIPYLGGLAIVAAFALAVLLATFLNPPVTGTDELVAILGFALLLSLLGLIDDLRGLNPLPKFAAQVAAGIALWSLGVGVLLFPSDVLNALFTVLWIVGVTNAFNLLDNMDGLSAGIATIAAGFFFLIAVLNGQILVAALSIALAGCALGFLRHNFHPARIYMGDAGSLFLGFLLAVIGIKLEFEGPTQITFLVPILVLGVPILDTALVTTTRLIHHRNPLSGGRDHTSHRLVFVGIPVRAAVSLIYAASIALGWLAVVMSRIDRFTGFILMGLVVAVSLFANILLGLVPVYESSRRRRVMIREVARHEEPEDVPATNEEPQKIGSVTA